MGNGEIIQSQNEQKCDRFHVIINKLEWFLKIASFSIFFLKVWIIQNK